MKRFELVQIFIKNGWWLKRSGSSHDIFTNGVKIECVPRHIEISENLAKAIIKRNGLKR